MQRYAYYSHVTENQAFSDTGEIRFRNGEVFSGRYEIHSMIDGINRKKFKKYNGRDFEVCWSDESFDPEWDDFLVSVPDGHHEQTSRWGQVRARYGWKVVRLTLKENGKIIAGVQVQIRPISRFFNGAYITYGPCIGTDEELVTEACIDEFKMFLQGLRVIYAVVGLPYDAYGIVPQMTKKGFLRKPSRLPPHFLEATVVLDLGKPVDDIMGAMRSRTRRNVRSALTRGIQVVEGKEEDIDTFRKLMFAICERRGIKPNPPQTDFFHHLWKAFNTQGWIKLFLAKNNQVPVSAAVAFSFRDWFRVWKVGWTGEDGNLKPNEAMWWEMIQYAQRTGHRHFDFVEVDINQAKAILDRKENDLAIDNVTSFKLGFGGDVKLLPGAYCYFSHPAIRMAMKWGLIKFLDSNLVIKLAQKYAR